MATGASGASGGTHKDGSEAVVNPFAAEAVDPGSRGAPVLLTDEGPGENVGNPSVIQLHPHTVSEVDERHPSHSDDDDKGSFQSSLFDDDLNDLRQGSSDPFVPYVALSALMQCIAVVAHTFPFVPYVALSALMQCIVVVAHNFPFVPYVALSALVHCRGRT
jgi:hypothetical protein